MRDGLHTDQRCPHARRRTHELECALSIGLEAGQELGEHRRQVPRELSLVDRRRRHDVDAETPSRLQRRHRLLAHGLIGARERLRHAEIVGKLDHFEVMAVAGHRAGRVHDLFEREEVRIGRRLAVAVPRRRAIAADLSLLDRLLQRRERVAQPIEKGRTLELVELTLGVVHVIDVDRRQP